MLSSLLEDNIAWLIEGDTGICAEYLGSLFNVINSMITWVALEEDTSIFAKCMEAS